MGFGRDHREVAPHFRKLREQGLVLPGSLCESVARNSSNSLSGALAMICGYCRADTRGARDRARGAFFKPRRISHCDTGETGQNR